MKMKSKKWTVFIITALLTASLSQRAHSAEPLLSDVQAREQISNVLQLKQPPANSEALGGGDWWRELAEKGPNVSETVMAMYSETGLKFEKLQLLGALAYFPNDSKVVAFLKKEAGNSNASIRETAIRSIGMSQGMVEHEFLAKQLTNQDGRTRAAAAQALSEIDDPRATSSVDHFLTQEKKGWIVSKIKTRRSELKAKLAERSLLEESRRKAQPKTRVASKTAAEPAAKSATTFIPNSINGDSENIRVIPLKKVHY